MSGYGADNTGWGGNYGFNAQNSYGNNQSNYGYSSQNNRGQLNHGFSIQNNPDNGFTSQSNRVELNYSFSSQNNQANQPNHGFNYQSGPGEGQTNYGFNCPNNEVDNQPNNGYNHQNNQGSNALTFFGSNHEENWRNDESSNFGPNNSSASFENYYGLSTRDSCNYNSGTDFNQEMIAPSELLNSGYGNSGFQGGNGQNPLGGKTKKGTKRPLPDDPKEKRRIKRNNRNNKKGKMAKTKLLEMAAKNAPPNLNVDKLSKKKLRQLARVSTKAKSADFLNTLPKIVLMGMASKHVSENINIKAFTKRGLKTFLKQVDPDFLPSAGTNVAPTSKKSLRKWNAAQRMAENLVKASKRAEEPLANDEDKTLCNPVKILETVYMRKVKFEESRKHKKPEKSRQFCPKTIRSRYNELKQNKVLDDYNGLALAGFLRHALFQIFPKYRVNASILSGYVLDHPNVLKLLQYEVRKLVDKKFESDNNATVNKRALLVEIKAEVLDDDVKYFEDDRVDDRAWLMDGCIDILAADVYPPELVPDYRDYMRDPEINPTREESHEEFHLLFITFMYEALGFVIVDKLERKERVRFHLDNAIIAALLVEFVRSYDTYVEINPFQMFHVKPGDQLALPAGLNHYLSRKNNIGYCRNPQLGQLYTELRTTGAHVETNVLAALPENVNPSPTLLRNFSNLILFSDEMFSLARFKLIEHTPYLRMTREEKADSFNTLLRKTYREAYVMWESKLKMHEMAFKDNTGELLV